jgi:hypothetical protein
VNRACRKYLGWSRNPQAPQAPAASGYGPAPGDQSYGQAPPPYDPAAYGQQPPYDPSAHGQAQPGYNQAPAPYDPAAAGYGQSDPRVNQWAPQYGQAPVPFEPPPPAMNEPVTLIADRGDGQAKTQVERQRLAAIPVMGGPNRTGPANQGGQISADGNQGLMFSIDVHRVDLVPGGAAVINAQVKNRGTIVDSMTVDVIGLPREWVTILPSTVNLFVGAESTVQIRISPPHHFSTERGLHSVEVAAWSGTNPNVRCVQNLDVNVSGFADIDAKLEPGITVGRFEGKYRMTISNGGNAKMDATVRGVHDEGTVSVTCRPATLSIPPGSKGVVTVVAKPPFLFTGAPVNYSINVTVQTSETSRAFPVRYKQPPLLSKWQARIGAIVLVAILAVVAVALLHHKKANHPPTTPTTIAQTATTTAGSTPTTVTSATTAHTSVTTAKP